MKIQQYLLVLLEVLFPYMLNADITEDIHFSHIGLEEGLSHSTIFAINQDKGGNLWFATYDGVNKYDGYNFTVYRHQYTHPNSIASDISRCITMDDSDRIWIGTREGLSLYNHYKDEFSNYYYKRNGLNVAVTSIIPIKKDWLMLGTAEGILLFDVKKECFLSDTLSSSLHGLQPAALVRQDDCIYIGTEEGVYIYTLSNGILEKLVDMPAGIRVHAILCQMFNRIWLATEGDGLYLYDMKTKELKNYRYEDGKSGLNSNYVRSLALDTENRLWVGTYGGLNIYKEGSDCFSSIKSSEIQEGSLSQNSVRSIFRDSQGGMWLGTYWGGLNYYHPLCNRFQRIKHVPFLNSLSNNVVSCIVEDNKHNLWIGTSDGGLNYYDNASQLYKNYLFNSGNLDVPFKDIKTVYVDEVQDRIYVGAHAGGMMVLHRKSGYIEYYNRHNSNLPSNNIYSIISDGYGGLWVASLEYLLHFDIDKRNFTIVDVDEDGHKLQQYNRLLFCDSKKRIWAGGEMGISVFNQVGTSLLPNTDFQIASVLKQAFVNCFYQVENGREGSGIGLSLVQRLVELHHGRIILQSEVGKGSTFTIYLPQDESVYTQEELLGGSGNEGEQRVYSTNANDIYIGDDEKLGEEDSTDEVNGKRGTILVVEDNRELRRYLVNGLSALFDMLETENGQKALDILKDKDVDLIITDVMMPIMDGVRLCKLVKQNLRTCHIPVYMLSAKVDIKYQLEGLQVGADDYIAKPFSMEVLRTKILNMLRTRYRIFERYSNMTEIKPEKLTNNTMDEELLRKAIAIVEKNMDNVEFSTEQFAREMNMSRSNLHLKLKAITGKSAIDFIHKIRFNRACQLLKEGKYTVSEISFMVGYNTPSYFAARFKKYIGCLPTEYGKK